MITKKAIAKFLTELVSVTRFMVVFFAGMALLGLVLRALAPGESLTWLYKTGFLNLYDLAPVLVWVLVAILFYRIGFKVIQRIWPQNDKARQLAALAAFDTLTLESGEVLQRMNMAMGSAFSEIYLQHTPITRKDDGKQKFIPAALCVIRWNDDSETLHLFYLGSRRHNIVGGFSQQSLNRPTDKQSALRVLAATTVGVLGGEAAGDLKGIEADIADAISEKAGEHAAEKIASKKNWKIAGLQLHLFLETTDGTAVCELTTHNRITGHYDTYEDIPRRDREAFQQLGQFLNQIGIGFIPIEQADALKAQHKDSPRLRADSESLPGLPGELVHVTKSGQLHNSTATRARFVKRVGTFSRATLSAVSAVVGSWMILTLLGGHPPFKSDWTPQFALGGALSGSSSSDRSPRLTASASVFVIATSGASLNVRREPNVGAPILTKLPNKSSVFVCGEVNGWKQILTNSQPGWVAARFLKQDTTPRTEQQITMLASRCP